MDIKKIVGKAKGFVEEHGDDIKKGWKERAPGLKDDVAELKSIAKGEGSLTDKAKAAVEAIKDSGKPDADKTDAGTPDAGHPGEDAPKA